MKKTIKKTPPPTETLIEQEETKGKTISVYLDAKSLQFLDRLGKLYKAGRSKTIQTIIDQHKQGAIAILSVIPENQPQIADDMKKIIYG